MKGKKIIIFSIIINILLIGVIYNFIKKDYINTEKIIVKTMTGTEYENNITELNQSHTDYANYIQECKTQIASAITEKGIETSNEEALENMANNIRSIPFNSGSKLEKIKITNISTTQTLQDSSLELSALYDGNIIFNTNHANKEGVWVAYSQYMDLTITVDKSFRLAFIRTPYSYLYAVNNPVAFKIEDYHSKTVTRDTAGWTYVPYFPNGDVSPEYNSLSLGTTFNIKVYSYQEHTGMSEIEIYGFYEDGSSSAPTLSPNGSKLEKVTITNITPVSTIATESGRANVLYDGIANFNPQFNKEECCYVLNSSYIELEITVDKPFKLAYVRTPHESSYGVGNPLSFTIGGYTSPTMSRVADAWTMIPYVPSNDKFEYLSLGTTFRVKLNSGAEHTGMSELEFYGYYE